MERGAAIKVSSKEPTKRPGRFDRPKEMAPSSRNGSNTKYALKILRLKFLKKKNEIEPAINKKPDQYSEEQREDQRGKSNELLGLTKKKQDDE